MCTDKNITAKLDILTPPSILVNVDTRFKLTIPSGKNPLAVHIVVKEKVMNEYDVSVILLSLLSVIIPKQDLLSCVGI